MNLLRGKTTIAAIVLATGLILLVAQLIQLGVLPLATTLNYSPQDRQFIRMWLRLAGLVGVLLPLVGLIWGWRDRQIRTFFMYYFLVIFCQLISEQVVARFFFRSLVVPTGLLYSLFRIGQLWQAHQQLTQRHHDPHPRLILAVIWILLAFWAANLLVSVGIAVPAIMA
ncbi:hypothetical protein NEA10_06630 [Phormidium yuhuli AB48]|uniref:DUF4149 domain-containing protein n=1 Tax=Phormidium yuhuli AB48 TaxID=2940671 RepID=A0ABY5AUF6_9CYAN|nr:hypothetical protein [Phormidium yuhuli]USR92391.1 hypothetical protein NEA10_06630 [Phormidium yuhuli AB48]